MAPLAHRPSKAAAPAAACCCLILLLLAALAGHATALGMKHGIIYGTVRRGKFAVSGVTVRAYDFDKYKRDDFLGQDVTGHDGSYKIKYDATKKFDNKLLKVMGRQNPDIYIKVGKIRSEVYDNYNPKKPLQIDLQVA